MMSEKTKQYWLQKLQDAVNVLQFQFVKPISDLSEAVQKFVAASQQREQELLAEIQRLKQEQKKSKK